MEMQIPGIIDINKRGGGIALIVVARITSAEEIFDDALQPLCTRIYTPEHIYEARESIQTILQRMTNARTVRT